MKRLFEVNGKFFDNKNEAKNARGEFKPGKDGAQGRFEHEVHKGPDHRLFGQSKAGYTPKRGRR